MATCSPSELLSASAGFSRRSPYELELLKVALLCQILQASDPMANCDVSTLLGGAGAAETANGSIYSGGSPGGNGICVSSALAISGGGAAAGIYGGGGAPQTAAVGANATGKGAGGSGAAVITNADRAGGNGSPGIIIITEFY